MTIRRDGDVRDSIDSDDVTAPAQAAHLHRGAPGTNGDTVEEIHGPSSDANVAGCFVLDRAMTRDITANLGDYHVDVHTDAFPDGALRGQLDNASPIRSAVGFAGEDVVPSGSGASGSGGLFSYGFRGTSVVCFEADAYGFSGPLTSVDLHRGAPGENGELVRQLNGPSSDNDAVGCVDVGEEVFDELVKAPQGYYVDMHTADYPAGAVRAQLIR